MEREDIPSLSMLVHSHAFFARDGAKLAFGRRWDGPIIHISVAMRGVACGSTCPACGRKLIARKPNSAIIPHFAHVPLTKSEREAGIAPNCEHGGMTALHAYAEQLLNRNKSLVLAPVMATVGMRRRQLWPAREYRFDAARLEAMDGETIPDVILEKSGHRMHVEIFVTHRCGPEKRAKIARADMSALEIDLSQLPRDSSMDSVDEAILKTAPREWIHNRQAERLRRELEREIAAEAERAEAKRKTRIQRTRATYASACKDALGSDWSTDAAVRAIIEANDGELLAGPSGGEGYFAVHPNVWKAAVLGEALDRYTHMTTDSAVHEFRKRGWLNAKLCEAANDEDLCADSGLLAGGPEAVVLGYLRFLSKRGVAEDCGWSWRYSAPYALIRDQRMRAVVARQREETARIGRRERLVTLAGEIAALGTEAEAMRFDQANWERKNGAEWKLSWAEIADAGEADWRALSKGLSSLLAVLKDESEEPVQDFGLPVLAP